MPKGRVSNEEREDRLAACEDAMIRLRSTHDVILTMTRKFGVSRSAVRSWCRVVRDRWLAQAGTLNQTGTRAEARERLLDCYAAARNRVTFAKAKDGSTILDNQGNPIRLPSPDLRAALHALRELNHLEGNHKPIKLEHEVRESVASVEEALKNSSPETRAALKRHMASLGGTAALAGEGFVKSGT
jgi:hypothetical protein